MEEAKAQGEHREDAKRAADVQAAPGAPKRAVSSAVRSRPVSRLTPGIPSNNAARPRPKAMERTFLACHVTKTQKEDAQIHHDPSMQGSVEGRRVRWAPAQRSCVQRTSGRVGRSERHLAAFNSSSRNPHFAEAVATKLASPWRCPAPRRGTSAMTFAWHSQSKAIVIITTLLAAIICDKLTTDHRSKASALGEAAQLPPCRKLSRWNI